jgi:putative transposase
MDAMGLEAIYPKKNLSRVGKDSVVYPYLLRGLEITRPNQVWATDITYIRMNKGFIFLVAILDWFSRFVLTWHVSNTLDTGFCIDALNRAFFEYGTPEIFNSDQGSQFTSREFIEELKKAGVKISHDGRGRALDNVRVERLWRTVKYEEVYIKDYDNVEEAIKSLSNFIKFYNMSRPHQALDYKTPNDIYFAK